MFIEFYDDDNKDDEFLGRAKIQTSLVAMRGHIGEKVLFAEMKRELTFSFSESHWVNLVDADQGSVQVRRFFLRKC